MKFIKMQGAGNDYVYLDLFRNPLECAFDELAVRVSDRHFGIGSDGLILIMPGDRASVRMRMFNADGSESSMCGNGIRCVAKYVVDEGLAQGPDLTIETGRGVLALRTMAGADGKVARVAVDMGAPILAAKDIPSTGFGVDTVVSAPLRIGEREFAVTLVSMGNPHCVIFVDSVASFPVAEYGALIEKDAHFPSRTNVEFVERLAPGSVRIRTWERGAGETLACGTGASAVAVALGLVDGWRKDVRASVLGGELELLWQEDGHVRMTGPAVHVFSGEFPL